MSRYIDAEWLIEEVDGNLTDSIAEHMALEKIADAPSIDIVFCKECKHYNGEYCFRLVSKDAWDLIGSQCVITMQPNDFCSYGERKESE